MGFDLNSPAAARRASRLAQHGWRRSRRPVGLPTRGKTACNRLRRVDVFLLLYDAHLLRREDGLFTGAWFVDLGYGAEPVTTLESAARFRRINPHLPVMGVEIDPLRVAAAQPFADERTEFRLGGFNLPLRRLQAGQSERVRAIRAFNVLRQYKEEDVEPAWSELASAALPGALLIEGTSDPSGSLWVANVLRRECSAPCWRPEALVFSTKLRTPFAPEAFQAVLPKNLIHRMQPGEMIYDFLEAWKHAAQVTAHERVWGERRRFVAAGQKVRAYGFCVDVRRRWLARGYLLLQAPFYKRRSDGGDA
ncbi:MAG: hypothetical protein NZ553_19145 [Caldilinea sp.]|nr:hypothetical protein [Caldilinea sp.]MDW8442598.1 hypothetical protein [Caldilineaceae bacterium]